MKCGRCLQPQTKRNARRRSLRRLHWKRRGRGMSLVASFQRVLNRKHSSLDNDTSKSHDNTATSTSSVQHQYKEVLKSGWLRKKGQMRWFELVALWNDASSVGSCSGSSPNSHPETANEHLTFALRWFKSPEVCCCCTDTDAHTHTHARTHARTRTHRHKLCQHAHHPRTHYFTNTRVTGFLKAITFYTNVISYYCRHQ